MRIFRKKYISVPLIVIASLTLVYSVLVFSPIPFIAYWRGIWIETAMTTADHQWLATAFIPKGVIDKVMNGKKDTSDVIGGKDFLDETTDSSDTKDASDDTTAPDTIVPDEAKAISSVRRTSRSAERITPDTPYPSTISNRASLSQTSPEPAIAEKSC